MRVLVIGNDVRRRTALDAALDRNGFTVFDARGTAGGIRALRHRPELILLDIDRPDQASLRACARIRKATDCPIIVMAEQGGVEARNRGLNAGADDFLVRPLQLGELIARMSAASSRGRHRPTHAVSGRTTTGLRPAHAAHVQVSGDALTRTVLVDGVPVSLTRKEFHVLLLLSRTPGVVLPRELLLAEVWQSAMPQTDHTLDVHIATLRRKLGVPGLIETVHGVGYRLAVDG